MVGSVGGWETIACAAANTVYIGLGCYRVAAGAQAIYVWLNDAGAGIIGKANSHRQKNNKYSALFFISPDAENNNEQVQRDPEFRVAHQGHQPVEKRVRKVVIDEVK